MSDHNHSHNHNTETEVETEEELFAMLRYTLAHNTAHAKDLGPLAHQLKHFGYSDAALKIKEALTCFEKGNEYIVEAIKLTESEAE